MRRNGLHCRGDSFVVVFVVPGVQQCLVSPLLVARERKTEDPGILSSLLLRAKSDATIVASVTTIVVSDVFTNFVIAGIP